MSKDTFYKLLGLLTWRALKLYISQKTPPRSRLIAGGVLIGVLVAAGSVAAAKREELAETFTD